MIRLPFRLLLFSLRLVMLPLKIIQGVMTFVTCIVPLIFVIGIAALIIWFFFIR